MMLSFIMNVMFHNIVIMFELKFWYVKIPLVMHEMMFYICFDVVVFIGKGLNTTGLKNKNAKRQNRALGRTAKLQNTIQIHCVTSLVHSLSYVLQIVIV